MKRIRAVAQALVWTALPAVVVAAPPQLESALATQQQLAEQRPDDPAVHNDLGNLLHLAEQPEEAQAAYERALGLDAEHASALFNLALLQQETGQPRRARQHLRRLVDLEPRNAWAHYHLGSLLAESGRRQRALRHFVEAFRLDPRLTEPRVNPHVLVNQQAAAAVLIAFAGLTAAETTPRVYDRPSRVTRLLMPEAAPGAGQTAAPAPAAEATEGEVPEGEAPEAGETPPGRG